ncbi:MAG: efflux RND transporter periplasmic adaptor subunit [Candidatus Aminicenantes bacterium]|nr:MAG: efflux RND transporter periplasmic adaptor subunit [Candidatus Aminicenantes bacterium]
MIIQLKGAEMDAKKNKSKKKKIIFFSLIGLIIILIIFFNLRAQREKALKVSVAKVERADLVSIVSASGEIKPRKNINISAHIPGRIVKIGVEEGQRVKAGDFLLMLDSTQYQAEVDRNKALLQSYKADLIRAEAVLKKDEKFYQRQKKLYEEQLISQEQLEAAQAQYEVSKAQYEALLFQIKQAEAALRSAQDNLNKTVYNSPIDGIITSLRVEEGEIALVGTMNNPGTVLMTIADLSVMEVEVLVDETDVIGIKLGQPAEIKVDALPEKTLKGHVTEIGSSALQKLTSSEESKDFKVVITLDDPPPELKPGLSAMADIITAEKKGVLAVPISAIVIKEEPATGEKSQPTKQEGVFLVGADNRVKFTPVKKGIMGEMKIEIKEGLKEGDLIVVGPFGALRQLNDGDLIKPEEKTSS